LAARDAGRVIEQLRRDDAALAASLFFIENHDEARAAAVFNNAENLAAAALILALPGAALIHAGQVEGKKEKLPVQRLKPLLDEAPDLALQAAYRHLLSLTSAEVFKTGRFALFDCRVWGTVAFMRQGTGGTVGYMAQISEAWHHFHSASFDISPLAQAIGADRQITVTNLLTASSLRVEARDGTFKFTPEHVGVGAGTRFCFIKVTTA